MDPLSTAGSCLSLVNLAFDIHQQLNGNHEECARLLERCEALRPSLQRINKYDSTKEPCYLALQASLRRIVKFCGKYGRRSLYRATVRIAFRNTHSQTIIELGRQLCDSATFLGVVLAIDFEQERKRDMEVGA